MRRGLIVAALTAAAMCAASHAATPLDHGVYSRR